MLLLLSEVVGESVFESSFEIVCWYSPSSSDEFGLFV